MRKGTLKGPITNRRKTEINATSKTVYVPRVKLKKKGKTGKWHVGYISSRISFHAERSDYKPPKNKDKHYC